MTRRPTTIALPLVGLALAAFALTFADATWLARQRTSQVAATAALVQRLGLTDIALFTEARYTRHLSQADLHSAYQDHPLGLEHFPSGSLVPPPRHHEAVDREAALPD